MWASFLPSLSKHWWICGFPTSAASSVCGSLSKAQDAFRRPTAQHLCSTSSILWHSEIWPSWQDAGLAAGTTARAPPAARRRTPGRMVVIGSPGTENPFHREATWASESPINGFQEISSQSSLHFIRPLRHGLHDVLPSSRRRAKTQKKDSLFRLTGHSQETCGASCPSHAPS